jgi:hypothetical protein
MQETSNHCQHVSDDTKAERIAGTFSVVIPLIEHQVDQSDAGIRSDFAEATKRFREVCMNCAFYNSLCFPNLDNSPEGISIIANLAKPSESSTGPTIEEIFKLEP